MEEVIFKFVDYVFTSPEAIAIHISVIAGGLIGLERTSSGAPAGFRTHILVCLASTILTVVSHSLPPNMPLEVIRADPTRMAQGIMTGIGFLGAGVIMKAGLSIRGLTTAASIWITAAIGILIGMHSFEAAGLAVLGTLSVLYIFRWFEKIFPTKQFGKVKVIIDHVDIYVEEQVKWIFRECGVNILKTNYGCEGKDTIELRFTVETASLSNYRLLANMLVAEKTVKSFDVQTIKG